MNCSVLTVIIILFSLSCGAVVSAASLDNFQIIKISAKDGRAVVKMPDGKLRVIKPGDVIIECVTVKEIAPGLIVLEDKTDRSLESVIFRLENDKQRIERRRKQPENTAVLLIQAQNPN